MVHRRQIDRFGCNAEYEGNNGVERAIARIAGDWLKKFARMTRVINRGVRRPRGKCDGRRWSLRQILGSVTLFCVSFAILSSLWRSVSGNGTVRLPAILIAVTAFWIAFMAASGSPA